MANPLACPHWHVHTDMSTLLLHARQNPRKEDGSGSYKQNLCLSVTIVTGDSHQLKATTGWVDMMEEVSTVMSLLHKGLVDRKEFETGQKGMDTEANSDLDMDDMKEEEDDSTLPAPQSRPSN